MNYDVVYIAKQALILALVLSMPVVFIGSLVGLLFSLFQSLTQIQDQTLSFAIKLVFILLVLYLSINWMAGKLYSYTLLLYSYMLR